MKNCKQRAKCVIFCKIVQVWLLTLFCLPQSGTKHTMLKFNKCIFHCMGSLMFTGYFFLALSVSATGRLSDICGAGVGSTKARAPSLVRAGPHILQPGHRLRSDPLPGKTAVNSTRGCHGTSWRGQTFDSPD